MATEPTCPIWTGSSVVEQMPAKGMVVSSSLTRPVGFPTAWPLCRQRRKLNAYFQHNMGKLTYHIIYIITLMYFIVFVNTNGEIKVNIAMTKKHIDSI